MQEFTYLRDPSKIFNILDTVVQVLQEPFRNKQTKENSLLHFFKVQVFCV